MEDVIVLEKTSKIVICEVSKQYKVKIIIENDYPKGLTFPVLHAYVVSKQIDGNYLKIVSFFWVPGDECRAVFHVTDGPECDAAAKVLDFFDGDGFVSANSECTMEAIMNWGCKNGYNSD